MGIELSEYFKEITGHVIPEELITNATLLLEKVNALMSEIGIRPEQNSGYRSLSKNALIGGSKKSAHCEAKAIDLKDASCRIKTACADNDYALLKKYDLYMEAQSATPNWCHLTTRPPRSMHREFIP